MCIWRCSIRDGLASQASAVYMCMCAYMSCVCMNQWKGNILPLYMIYNYIHHYIFLIACTVHIIIHSHLSSAVEVTLYGACPLEVSGSTRLWRTSPSTVSVHPLRAWSRPCRWGGGLLCIECVQVYNKDVIGLIWERTHSLNGGRNWQQSHVVWSVGTLLGVIQVALELLIITRLLRLCSYLWEFNSSPM